MTWPFSRGAPPAADYSPSFLLALGAVLCAGATGCRQEARPVVFGAMGRWSNSAFETLRMGMRLAEEQVNESGGIRERPLELRFVEDADEQGEYLEWPIEAAQALAADPSVVAVASGGNSVSTDAALSVLEGELPMVIAVAPYMGGHRQWGQWLSTPVPAIAIAIVDAAEAMGSGPLGLIYDNTPGGRALAAAVLDRLSDPPVVLQPVFYDSIGGGFRPVAEVLAAEGVDRVILVIGVWGGRILPPLLREVLPKAEFVVMDAVAPLIGMPELTGARMVLPAHLDRMGRPADTTFARSFRDRFGREPDPSAALGYDAIRLLARAAIEAGPERAAIAHWLQSLDPDAPYEAVTGPMQFDEEGRRLGLESSAKIICRGGWVSSEGSCS